MNKYKDPHSQMDEYTQVCDIGINICQYNQQIDQKYHLQKGIVCRLEHSEQPGTCGAVLTLTL